MISLYSIADKTFSGPNEINLTIALNADHKIFAAHFPDDPILPGVCMIQIVKETIGTHMGQKLLLKKGRNIKFLAKVNPVQFPVISMKISIQNIGNQEFQVSAQTNSEELVFFKFSGVFSTQLDPA